MLEKIAEVLGAGSLWVEENKARGELVRLYREYYRGDHRLKMTPPMMRMMQITDRRTDRYNANYCSMVIDTMADRLTVERIDADTPEGTDWAQRAMTLNRFDALQMRVREAALRDGECFVMSEWDEDRGRPRFARELTWDGETGILVRWDDARENIVAAAKVWMVADGSKRVNIYTEDMVRRYAASDAELALIDEESTIRDGQAPGVPLVRFAHKERGVSELVNIIPLQDSLNRTLASMVMSAELTSFSVHFVKGFDPPGELTPGMFIVAMVTDEGGQPLLPDGKDEAAAYAAYTNAMSLERIEAGSLAEMISQAEFLIDQISTVSSTPLPGGSANASGEALKQRDIRLLGKVTAAQVAYGNAWEDVLTLAARQQTLFATTAAPQVETWNARWKAAEIRNDKDVVEAADKLHTWGYKREALRMLSQSSLLSLTEEDIDRMLAESARDVARATATMAGSLPPMDNFEF